MKKTVILLLAVMVISHFCSIMSVGAGALVQSGNRISVNLMHEHTEAACWEQKWIPCGGMWMSNFEPSVGSTVYYCSKHTSTEEVDGVVLASIHDYWVTNERSGAHSGEYISRMNCNTGVLGSFVINKTADEDNNVLTASVVNSTGLISNASISWRRPDNSIVNGNRVFLSQNGIYTATLVWNDAKTGARHQSTLNYTDISSPVTLVFQSDGEILFEEVMSYGDLLPEIELPAKTGYNFLGFYAGNVMWYDGDAIKNESIRITGSSLEQIVEAVYEVRSYNVYYGPDKDNDGQKDHFFQVTYGEPYESVAVYDVQKEDWIFEGYYWNGEKVFDSKGRSTGVWLWDSEEDIVLEAVYRQIEKPSPDDHNGMDQSNNSGSENQGNNSGGENQGHNSGGDDSNASHNSSNTPVIEDDRNVSDNAVSVSDNSSVSENLAGPDNYDDGSGDESRGNDGRDGLGSGNNRNTTGTTGSGSDIYQGRIEDDEEERNMSGRNTGGFLNQRYAADQDVDGDAEETDVLEEVNLLPENLASDNSVELQRLKNRAILLKAVKVTGITVGTLGICYLIGWLLVSKFGLARIYSLQADGNKCQIGDALILRGENAFHVKIKDKVAQKGDTGRYQVVFSKSFVLRHHNQDIIIHCLGKSIAEIVRPDINMYIE